MPIGSELLILEVVREYADILTENPVIPNKVSVFTYDSIDGDGAYVGLKQFIGSDVAFNKLIPYPNPIAPGKRNKSINGSDMPADNIAVYELTSGDIAALGSTIDVINPMVNNYKSACEWAFDGNQGSLIAGNQILFNSLPAKSDVTKFTFSLI